MSLTFNFAAKWLLTWMTPGLALQTIRRHQEARSRVYRMKIPLAQIL